MEKLKIKHKEYEVVEIIKDNVYKCSFKNKQFLVYKYESGSSEFSEKAFLFKQLKNSSVNTPKLIAVDKKGGYFVREYLEGVTMFDYILDHDFSEDIYKQIFRNSYMARVVGMNLNYELTEWMLVGETLYYIGTFCEKYDPKKDFTKEVIRLWFLSKDLAKYYEKNGVLFDKTRLKEDYAVNKDMVLMTCKYYM